MGKLGRSLGRAFLSALLVVTATGAVAQSGEVIVEEGSVFIPLATAATGGNLAVEIDGIDVTDFIEITEDGILLWQDTPLSGGDHLVVVYLLSDAGFEEIGTWSFATDGASAGSSYSLTVDAVHEAGTRRVNDDETSYAESSGSVEVSTEDGNFSAGADYIATTVETNRINGNEIDIGEYYLSYDQPGSIIDFSARLGHQSLDYDDVLISDLSRRGVSFQMSRPDQRLQFGVFGSRVADELGADNFTGLERSEDRIYGAQFGFRPFGSSDFRITMQSYEGEGDPFTSGTSGTGSGYSLGFDGSFNDGRGRYRAGAGRALWDEDGAGVVEEEVEADAMLAGIDYDLLTGEDGRYLTLGIGYERVDEAYFSLANPGIAPDREDVFLSLDYSTDTMSFFGRLDTQLTNINGPADVETDRYDTVTLDARWMPEGETGFARADYYANASLQTKNREETPLGAPVQSDFTSLDFGLGFDVSGDQLDWGLGYAYIDYNDESAFDEDETSHEVSLHLDYRPTDQLDLSLNTSATRIDGFAGDWVDGDVSVSMGYQIVPGTWAMSANANYASYGEPGVEDGSSIRADLTWSFNPAADLIFSAGYAKGANATETTDDEEWSAGILLRATTSIFR